MLDPSISPNAALPTRKCRIFILTEDYWINNGPGAGPDHAKALIDDDGEDEDEHYIYSCTYDAPVGFEWRLGYGELFIQEHTAYDTETLCQVFENGKWSYLK